MGFAFKNSGIAASVFLVLYTIYTAFTIKVVYDKGWRSIYTSLLIFGIFRVCGQFSGVAFAALGYEHYQWLIAYLVFTAEGYFVLILSSFHLLAKAQVDVFGYSWIRPTRKQREEQRKNATNWRQKLHASLPPSTVFHALLIPANAFIISGGSMLTGQGIDNIDQNKLHTSKALRTVGQIVFLAQTLMAILLAVYVYFKEGLRHHNVYAIFLVAPFLLVRGIFGIMSIYVNEMNYYDMRNYSEDGLKPKFVVFEYVLAATMEFIAGSIYISLYYFDKTKKNENGDILVEEETEDRKEAV
ncbi:hypothetical protein SBY92_004471 [Candida maltosa Xu316]|uniref:Uncharacterized protein n=1 Tax=Candida maltosa (strain Xu316) TaxID=1245528 RepID=M3JC00_CANMX|nr:hypothetical protein G210_5527 [Candida maltosa Xu316]